MQEILPITRTNDAATDSHEAKRARFTRDTATAEVYFWCWSLQSQHVIYATIFTPTLQLRLIKSDDDALPIAWPEECCFGHIIYATFSPLLVDATCFCRGRRATIDDDADGRPRAMRSPDTAGSSRLSALAASPMPPCQIFSHFCYFLSSARHLAF